MVTIHVYVCFRVTVLEKTYSGLGTTKTDAKTNAAANALEALRAAGTFTARERQVNAERRRLLAERHMLGFQYPECKHGQLNIIIVIIIFSVGVF